MNITLREDKFHIRVFFAPCSCKCKFCCLGDFPQTKQISFDDYEKVMRKFIEVSTVYGMKLKSFIYNCPNHKYISQQISLYDSLQMERNEYTQLDLNGTRIKNTEEISSWFDELQNAGIEKVAFSWFGLEKNHDTFVKKNGYFSYLNSCALEAKKKEYARY